MAETNPKVSNIDVEKALGQSEEPPLPASSKQTWGSKDGTLRSNSADDGVVVEDDDSDEESSKRSSAVSQWRD